MSDLRWAAGAGPPGRNRLRRGAREASVLGQPVGLTPKEFDLLTTLVSAPRQAFSRAQALRQVRASQETGYRFEPGESRRDPGQEP